MLHHDFECNMGNILRVSQILQSYCKYFGTFFEKKIPVKSNSFRNTTCFQKCYIVSLLLTVPRQTLYFSDGGRIFTNFLAVFFFITLLVQIPY